MVCKDVICIYICIRFVEVIPAMRPVNNRDNPRHLRTLPTPPYKRASSVLE